MPYTIITLKTYFVADINIPNALTAPVSEELDMLINRFEKECMSKLLGPVLFGLMGTESSARITAIKNGTSYVVNGTTYTWKGLSNADTLTALPAYYVYFKYKDIRVQVTTGTGTKSNDQLGGRAVSPMYQMVQAWNKFSEWSFELIAFLINYVDEAGERIYPEFETRDYYAAREFSKKINEFGI